MVIGVVIPYGIMALAGYYEYMCMEWQKGRRQRCCLPGYEAGMAACVDDACCKYFYCTSFGAMGGGASGIMGYGLSRMGIKWVGRIVAPATAIFLLNCLRVLSNDLSKCDLLYGPEEPLYYGPPLTPRVCDIPGMDDDFGRNRP
jgi:hypothetical protein